MKKSLATFALAAGIAGGVGALAFTPALAGAQVAGDAIAPALTRVRDGLPGGHHGHAALKAGAADVAGYLGLTTDEIRTALKSGTTLAQLAIQQGKTVDGLVNVIVTAEGNAIDSAVANGKLDADRAAAIKAKLAERTTSMVNNARPGPGAGFGGSRDRRGPGAPATNAPA